MKTIIAIWVVCALVNKVTAQAICDFSTENTPSNTVVRLAWVSDPGAGYVIEQASTLEGEWNTVENNDSSDVTFATGFFTDGRICTTNKSCFLKINKVDRSGPEIIFVSPIDDEIVFDPIEPIRVSISDSSEIDPDSINLYIDGIHIDSSEILYEDGILTYMPSSGSLGISGQEIDVKVDACDLKGNSSSAIMSFVIASPLECLATSMICVGDPAMGSYTYQIVGDETNRLDDVLLWYMDDESMIFSNADIAYFTAGEYVVSQIPTNSIFRKILSAEVCIDGVRVETTNVPIYEIFRGSFQTSSCLEVYDPEAAVRRNLLASGGRQLLGISIDTGGINDFSRQKTYGKEIGKAFSKVDVALSSELGIRINGACMAKGNIGLRDTDLEVFMEGEIIFTESDTLTLSAVVKDYSPVDRELPLAKTFIPVAPPYVWIEVDYDLHASLDVNASVVASIGAVAEQGATFCLHARRKNGEWYAYPDNWASGWTSGSGSFEAGGEVGVKLGVGLKITTLIESLVGPYISVGPFISATAGVKKDFDGNTIVEERKIIGGIEGKIGVDYLGSSKPKEFAHMSLYEVLYNNSTTYNPPQFLWFPGNASYLEGETVSLVPSVYGDEPISYAWSKDGVPIRRTDKDLTFVAAKNLGGIYTCVASNPYGESQESVTIEIESSYKTIADFAGTWRGKLGDTTHLLYISPNGATTFKCLYKGAESRSASGYSQVVVFESETYVLFIGDGWTAFRVLSDTKGVGEPVQTMTWTRIN